MKLKQVPAMRRAAREAALAARSAVPELEARDDAAAEAHAAPADSSPEDGDQASDVRGLIDNATADRLYGWAWDTAYPGRRLKVELRLAGEVVANTVADFVRPDLVKNNIGDGCHAFEFPLVPDWVERKTELTAVAFGVDGSEFPIAVRIRRQDDAAVATALQRLVEGVAAEQAAIRREFQDMRDRATRLPEAEAVATIHASQDELVRKVDGLEVWLTRLDAKLSDAAAPTEATGSGRLDPWQAVLIAVLASAASAALALSAARLLL